jgi:phage baseplate assembly protein V
MDVDSGNVFPRTKIGRDHQLRDAFRHGKVIERKIDEKTKCPVVRVQFLDKQGLVSYWLPIKQFGGRKTLHFYVPKIGDNVNVNFLANGVEHGFVDGSYFTKKDPPPDLDIDTRHYKTEDGTVIEYRETDSTFRLDVGGATAKTGPRAGKAGGGAIVIVGDIQHTGNMTTSGTHTDANGVHMGGTELLDELRAEIKALKKRVTTLELKVR